MAVMTIFQQFAVPPAGGAQLTILSETRMQVVAGSLTLDLFGTAFTYDGEAVTGGILTGFDLLDSANGGLQLQVTGLQQDFAAAATALHSGLSAFADVVLGGTAWDNLDEVRTWGDMPSGYFQGDITLLGDAPANAVGPGVLTGNSGSNQLSGGSIMFGGEGDDTIHGGFSFGGMYGGPGDDTYYVLFDSGIHELPGEGIDTVHFTALRAMPSLPPNIENGYDHGGFGLIGNKLDNLLVGNMFSNDFIGKGGNDTIDGLDGIDKAVVLVNLSAVTGYSGSLDDLVLHTAAGDTEVVNIERVVLADAAFVLDTQPGDHAWQAEALLWTALGEAPNVHQLGKWTQTADEDWNMKLVAGHMIQAFSLAPTTADLVTTLYTHIAGVAPTPQQVDEFVARVGPGLEFETGADLMAWAAASDYNTARFASVVGDAWRVDPSFFHAVPPLF